MFEIGTGLRKPVRVITPKEFHPHPDVSVNVEIGLEGQLYPRAVLGSRDIRNVSIEELAINHIGVRADSIHTE